MSNTNPNSPEDLDPKQASENTENLAPEEDQQDPSVEDGEEAGANSVEEQQAAEIADLKEKLLRAMADTENTRRRSQKDKEDAINYGITKFARDVLTISDNLRRAIEAVSEEDRENESVKTLLSGIEMTETELQNTLTKHKVEVIEAEGKKFDPNLHQAMFEIENPDVEPGTVLQVMQAGYVIAGRLLRPSLVGVAKGGQKKQEAPVDQSV